MGAQRRQYGLSLIELMVSLLLSALVLLGLVVLFQQGKISAMQDEQVARMQENGRYALRVLSRELAMMNYFGGMIDTDPDPLALDTGRLSEGADCNDDWMISVEMPLEFFDKDDETGKVDDPDYDCIDDHDVVDGTDGFAIKRVGDYALREYDADGALTAASGDLTPGTAYFFTNGSVGALYSADSAGDTCADCTVSVPRFSSNVRQYQPQIFYVRPDSAGEDGIPTLVRETLQGDDMRAEVLVEGVEDMQIEWGVDGADDDLAPDHYTADPDNAELADAATARIFLLVRGIRPVTGYVNDKTYKLGRKTVAARNDAFYRRVYSMTVQLRNSEKLQMSSPD